MESRKLIVGTRSSKLALWQANFISELIKSQYPGLAVELKHIATRGDNILDKALHDIGSKGLFTKELEAELESGTIDIAVHSLKDLPVDLPPGLCLAAVTKRQSAEDALVARTTGMEIKDLPRCATVATGSLRRKAQLLHYRPDINVVDLRGNVTTRLDKFYRSDWDGMILARAGIERLGAADKISSVIGFDVMLPAVGQGTLAIEASLSNGWALEVAAKINDEETRMATAAERSFLRSLGGGCQTPIGGYAVIVDGVLTLEGVVCSTDGSKVIRDKVSGSPFDAEEIGSELAAVVISKGGDRI